MRALMVLLALCACEGKKAGPATVPVKEEKPAMVPTKTPVDPTAIIKGHNNFAIELFGKLPQGNVAVSPASITIALAMTWAGAKGQTADEIGKTLHFAGDQPEVLSRWGQLTQSLVGPSDAKRPFTLRIANRLFVDKHRELDTVFFDINMKTFGSRIDVFDFQAEPDDARQKINFWVAKETEDRIQNLLPPNSITSATRLVVVNALYFLADWADPFDKNATRPQAFHVSATETKQVPMMHRLGGYRYAHEDGAALLELPYRFSAEGTDKTNVAMYVLLPDAVDGLPAIEAKLADTVRALQGKLAATDVSVALPKFTIDPPGALELQKPLTELGIKAAFTPSADFTGISKDNKEPLFISSVLHKAFVKVDEAGTEAAAATAIAAPTGGPPKPGTPFTADHPFIFMIIDRTSGLMLFIGRVASP